MRLTQSLLPVFLLITSAVAADPPPKKNTAKATPSSFSSSSSSTTAPAETNPPCTIRSLTSGKFFDLNPLHVAPLPEDSTKKPSSSTRTESWHARGYDYGANFTINFCGGLVEDLTNGGWGQEMGSDGMWTGWNAGEERVRPGVVGLERELWGNVSAVYVKDGQVYSIGQLNSDPVIRGRKLLLNYTDGSPCPSHPYSTSPHDKREALSNSYNPKTLSDTHFNHIATMGSPLDHSVESLAAPIGGGSNTRRKNTVISLLCEDEPTAPKVSLAFLASPDECSYFFELRSPFACPAVNVAKQQVGPSGVFGLIAFIAILVYIVGGVVYQRAVMHQRGWRQLPNYALWAGIVGFVSDMFIILFSSCMRFVPWNRGKRFQLNSNGYASGRGGVEEDNRIIDSLDEEWRD